MKMKRKRTPRILLSKLLRSQSKSAGFVDTFRHGSARQAIAASSCMFEPATTGKTRSVEAIRRLRQSFSRRMVVRALEATTMHMG